MCLLKNQNISKIQQKLYWLFLSMHIYYHSKFDVVHIFYVFFSLLNKAAFILSKIQ